MADRRISIPNNWKPRTHQLPLWRYMDEGGLRAVAVWHRRAGKDSTAMNFTARSMFKQVGTYWHMLPESTQGRKVIWDGMGKGGTRFIDQAFPEELRKSATKDEMKIEMRNGSIWQVVGSDNYDSLLGANPIGVVFSEYSVANPVAWDYIRPILAENGGWAMFLYTPRGRNHGKKMFDMAAKNPDWFAELLSVDDTMVIAPSVIQSEKDSGMDDDMIQQEYFCSWAGVQQGSIYGEMMQKARDDGRVGAMPYDRRYPVNTFWDLGHSDTTAVLCHQLVGSQDRFLRSYEAGGEDMAHFVGMMKEWGYLYGNHYLPHDAKNVTLAAKSNPLGKNIWDQALALGMRDLVLVPRTPDVWTAIKATRMRFGTAYFDERGCEGLINALDSYHKRWDEKRHCFDSEPYHDWSSNYCDAFRQWAQGYKGPGGQAGTFTLPSAPPLKAQMGRVVKTVGSRTAGY